MQITFSVQGQDAGLVSYFFGKHPDNPFFRETDYGVIEFKFTEYRDDLVRGFIAFHANGLAMVQQSDYKGLEQYINDREFAISTIFLSNVRRAVGHVLTRDYEKIDTKYAIEAEIGPLSTTLTDDVVRGLFEPLEYDTVVKHVEAEYSFHADSGNTIAIQLKADTDLVSLFSQIYVLIPVLDNYKHYSIANDEAEKLLRYGAGWLDTHPYQELITKRYVRFRQPLVDTVLEQISAESDILATGRMEQNVRLAELRYEAFAKQIEELGVRHVVDMGAGEGRLLQLLLRNPTLSEVIACEPTERGLTAMHRKVADWGRQGEVAVQPKIWQSSLFYRDERLVGAECIVLCEVIEHVDPAWIHQVMRTLLSVYHPEYLLLSTPNRDYNAVYGLGDSFRHRDHRFEMTRDEFVSFIEAESLAHGYSVTVQGIGELHPDFGQPTQLAILRRG